MEEKQKSPTARVITRLLSYVFYEPDGEHYREGSAQVFVYGDRGFMFAISGKGFFKAFIPTCEEFLKTYNLKTLEGYMSKQNARSVRMGFHKNPNIQVELGPLVEVENHKVCWVTVKLKE